MLLFEYFNNRKAKTKSVNPVALLNLCIIGNIPTNNPDHPNNFLLIADLLPII